ncbi:MAG: DUF4349 domain-containing protein [Hyphomonadaceae bacterium]
MVRTLTAIGLVLALGACGQGGGGDGYARDEAQGSANYAMAPPMAAPAPPMESARMNTSGGVIDLDKTIVQPDPNQGGGAPPGMAPMMAYTYGWNFAVPTGEMSNLLAAHKKLCEDAGPSKCYVTGSNLNAIGKEGASGNLSMRATEAWVRDFEKGVGDGLKPFGGSIYSNNRTAEELTAQIVDNEARLKSMVAYRDSLQTMLASKPGKLSDLLEIQQTLAQAQGDIDSRESVLAALKLRVSMSVLNFSYQPEYAAASESIWRPLGDAFGDFVPSFARTLADIVRFIAGILPVLIFGGLAVFGLLSIFRWRGRRPKKPLPTPPSTVKAGGGGP